jgi:hypothetical protein
MLGASKRSPCATSAVADHHQQGYGELHQPEQPLIHHVPGRSIRGERPRERQHGHRYAKHAEKERDGDNPERPAPAPQDPYPEQGDESRDPTRNSSPAPTEENCMAR